MPQSSSREKGERRYTSLACLNCRRRKVKCNNEQPRCSNCRLYNNECVYGLDRRRTSASLVSGAKAAIIDDQHFGSIATTAAEGVNATQNVDDNLLNDQLLPPFIDSSNNNSDVPFENVLLEHSSTGQDWSYWASPDAGLQLFSDAPFDFAHGFAADGQAYAMRQEDHVRAFSTDTAFGETSPVSQGISPGGTSVISPTPAGSASHVESYRSSGRSQEPHPSTDDDDALHDVTKQLTSRLGRLQIAEDGRPRYYGATSNLHLLYSGIASLTQPNIRHVLTHGDAAIAAAGLEWGGDIIYEKHLINLFFSWHNTLQFPVDKDIFLREQARFRTGKRSEFFTPCLENAIYCIGCAYTDRSHPNIGGPTDEFFALRTKAYLDIELDSPSIATAQAILILSSHEAAHTRESRGWIYMGMAVQIITDLGLHLDLEREYSRLEKEVDADEITTTRRNVFWTVKSIDTLWSAYSGRPSLMKNLVHNQKGPVPSKTYKWDHYVDEHSTIKFPPNLNIRAAAYVHVHLASLMLILGRVAEVLYSGVPDISEDIQAFVTAADDDFRIWLTNLPSDVQLDLSQSFNIQGVLELHLIYHESVILLHRPLMTQADSTTSSALAPDRAAVSLNRCIDSANHICKILIHHRNRYGLKRLHHQMVHVAMTAALIHAFQLCTRPVGSLENKNAQTSFLTCIQALGEMGQTFKSASRALDVVTSLRQSWKDDTSVGDRFKRARLG